jgi:hypothetical protein
LLYFIYSKRGFPPKIRSAFENRLPPCISKIYGNEINISFRKKSFAETVVKNLFGLNVTVTMYKIFFIVLKFIVDRTSEMATKV